MQRFNLSFLALCLFVAVLASALPAQNKRGDVGDEAFHMADDFMNDPAFQTGGGIGQATVITPTNGPTPTPAPAKAHGPAGASSSSPSTPSSTPSSTPTPTPTHTPKPSKAASGTTFASTAPDATPTPSDPKEKGSFLDEIPVVGAVAKALGS